MPWRAAFVRVSHKLCTASAAAGDKGESADEAADVQPRCRRIALAAAVLSWL